MNMEKKIRLIETLMASGLYLDQGDYEAYLSLFGDDGQYQVVADVPEVNGQATWMDLDKASLRQLLQEAPHHQWNTGIRSRQIAMPVFTGAAEDMLAGGVATRAMVVVYRTGADGATKLYATGRYHDTWRETDAGWLLSRRVLHLDTRDLAPPSAIPL